MKPLAPLSLESPRKLLAGLAYFLGTAVLGAVVAVGLARCAPGWVAVALGALSAILTVLQLACAWLEARDLWRRRRVRHLLALLDHPLPAGWEGPFLVDAGRGRCAYRVDVVADRTPQFTEIVILERVDTGRPGDPLLCARVRSLDGDAPPPPARCRAILQRLFDGDLGEEFVFDGTESVKPDPRERWWLGYPLRPREPVALRDATAVRLAPDSCGFERPSFEIPEPVPFPREPFAGELARHQALVRAHIDALAFQVRVPDSDGLGPFLMAHGWVGLISLRGAEVRDVTAVGRETAAELHAQIFGIRHALQVPPSGEVLDVIVRTDDLVSLHRTRLVTTPLGRTAVRRAFVPDPEPLVFEPTRQEHARERGRTRVFWQATAGGEIHEAVTTAPEPARSSAELVDRLFASRYERIQRAIWDSARRHALSDGYVWFVNNRLSGEHVNAIDFRFSGWLEVLGQYPAIRRAMLLHRPYRRWYPVVIDGVRYAGLRWMPLQSGLDESTRPPAVDEVSTHGHLRVVRG